MPRPVPVRGVIEGFYGRPWTHDARLAVIEFSGAHDLNAYVYAPKSDQKHRDRWRDVYDEGESARFRDLVTRGGRCGVQVGFAISPGLDISYSDDADRSLLLDKLTRVADVGVDWFVLALDDIPSRPGLGREHADLAMWLGDALRSAAPRLRLSLVPTDYVGTKSTPYLDDLARHLPADVDLMWTGPTVCSPTITAGDARARADATGGRQPMVWDNYPVNDGPMEVSLHLGPYRGREAALTDEVSGVLCNPMLQPYASMPALAMAGAFLGDPDRYDADRAWSESIDAVGGARAQALRAFADACADGPLSEPRDVLARRLVAEAARRRRADGVAELLAALDLHLREVKDAARTWADSDDPLARDLAPWLSQARVEATAGLTAVRLLQELAASAPEPETLVLHAFAVVFAWSAARATTERTVFGPRFVVHPALVQLADASPALDVQLAVTEDASAIDAVCRLALDEYGRWASRH